MKALTQTTRSESALHVVVEHTQTYGLCTKFLATRYTAGMIPRGVLPANTSLLGDEFSSNESSSRLFLVEHRNRTCSLCRVYCAGTEKISYLITTQESETPLRCVKENTRPDNREGWILGTFLFLCRNTSAW